MEPIVFVCAFLATGVTLVGWATITHVLPGAWPSPRFMYGVFGVFVGGEAFSLASLVFIGRSTDNMLLFETMPLAFICFLLWWFLVNFRRLKLHRNVAKMFPPDCSVQCTELQIVTLLMDLSYEYPRCPFYAVRTEVSKRISVVGGSRVLATADLPLDADTFFGRLGQSFVGDCDWPADVHAIQAVRFMWLPDKGHWKLEPCHVSPIW